MPVLTSKLAWAEAHQFLHADCCLLTALHQQTGLGRPPGLRCGNPDVPAGVTVQSGTCLTTVLAWITLKFPPFPFQWTTKLPGTNPVSTPPDTTSTIHNLPHNYPPPTQPAPFTTYPITTHYTHIQHCSQHDSIHFLQGNGAIPQGLCLSHFSCCLSLILARSHPLVSLLFTAWWTTDSFWGNHLLERRRWPQQMVGTSEFDLDLQALKNLQRDSPICIQYLGHSIIAEGGVHSATGNRVVVVRLRATIQILWVLYRLRAMRLQNRILLLKWKQCACNTELFVAEVKTVCLQHRTVCCWSDNNAPAKQNCLLLKWKQCACNTELFVAEVKTMHLQHRTVCCWSENNAPASATLNCSLLMHLQQKTVNCWSFPCIVVIGRTPVQIQVLYRVGMMHRHHGTVSLQTVHVPLWSN